MLRSSVKFVCFLNCLYVSLKLIFTVKWLFHFLNTQMCMRQEGSKGLQFLDPKSRLQHAIVYTCKKRGLEVKPPVYR